MRGEKNKLRRCDTTENLRVFPNRAVAEAEQLQGLHHFSDGQKEVMKF